MSGTVHSFFPANLPTRHATICRARPPVIRVRQLQVCGVDTEQQLLLLRRKCICCCTCIFTPQLIIVSACCTARLLWAQVSDDACRGVILPSCLSLVMSSSGLLPCHADKRDAVFDWPLPVVFCTKTYRAHYTPVVDLLLVKEQTINFAVRTSIKSETRLQLRSRSLPGIWKSFEQSRCTCCYCYAAALLLPAVLHCCYSAVCSIIDHSTS